MTLRISKPASFAAAAIVGAVLAASQASGQGVVASPGGGSGQGLIQGLVGSPGFVKDPETGQPMWGDYRPVTVPFQPTPVPGLPDKDTTGDVGSQIFPGQMDNLGVVPGGRIVSGSELRAANAQATALGVSAVDKSAFGHISPGTHLRGDTRWVIARTSGPPETRLVRELTFNPTPQALPVGAWIPGPVSPTDPRIKVVLVDAAGNPVRASDGFITLQTDYMRRKDLPPNAGICQLDGWLHPLQFDNGATATIYDPRTRFENCALNMIGSTLNPLSGVEVDTDARWSFGQDGLGGSIVHHDANEPMGPYYRPAHGNLTNEKGFYDLPYVYPPFLEFHAQIWAIIRYAPFEPRGLSGAYYAYGPPVGVGATITVANTFSPPADFTNNRTLTSGSTRTSFDVNSTYMDTQKPREANIAVPVAFLQGHAEFANEPPRGNPGLLEDDSGVTIDEEGNTQYKYTKPNFGGTGTSGAGTGGAGGVGGAPGVADAGAPAVVGDDVHHGLLSKINRADLANTDLYVFTLGDTLLFERRGLQLREVAGIKCDENTKICTLDPDGTPPFPATFNPDAVIPFQTSTVSDVKVVLINRATGYIGTARASLNGGGETRGTGTGLDSSVIAKNSTQASNGQLTLSFPDILLKPPNLKVRVERVAKDETKTHVVGSEGSGLITDTSVTVFTDWYDSDGSALPAGLPGYTAHVAKAAVVDQADPPQSKLVPMQSTETGYFEVKPNSNTQVLLLPAGDRSTLEHYYVQVDGARNLAQFQAKAFEDNSTSTGLLVYRPRAYVPFLVPQLNKTATQAGRSFAKDNGLDDPGPVYSWLYRPEMQFSLFELSARLDLPDPETDINLLTNTTKALSISELKEFFRYGITPPSAPMIEQTGPPRQLVFNIGGQEFAATVDNSPEHKLNFVDPTALDRLSPTDFLTISLYQQNDSENVLWQRQKSSIEIHVESSKPNIPIGEWVRVTAKTIPDGMVLDWRVIPEKKGVHAHVEQDRKVDAASHQVLLAADEGSAGGWVKIRAFKRDEDTVYAEKRVFIGCLACEAGRTGRVALNSVDFSIGLGSAANGEAAGGLFLKSKDANPNLTKPSALEVDTWSASAETLTDLNGPRQVAAPNSFTDIVTGSDSSYEVRLYDTASKGAKDPATGLYKVAAGAQAVATWKIENPDPANQDGKHVKITETRGAHPIVTQYDWHDENNGWTLTQGNGLAQTEQKIALGAGLDRVETKTTSGPDQRPVAIEKTTYTTFKWGEAITESTLNAGGDEVKTNFSYYADDDPAGAGRVKLETNSDGSWIEYHYDSLGRKSEEHRPFLDAPSGGSASASIVTHFQYTPVDGQDVPNARNQGQPRVVWEELGGRAISRTLYAYITDAQENYTQIVERCVNPNASYKDPTNERTETSFNASDTGLPGAGEISKRVMSDGRSDLITYAFEGNDPAGKSVRRTTVHGTGKDATPVAGKTTKEVLVKDPSGNATFEETQAFTSGGYAPAGSVTRTFDKDGHVTRADQSNGLFSTASWDCCLATTRVDELGRTSTTIPDDLKRPQTVTTADGPNGSMTVSYTYDAAGRVLTETVNGGGITQLTTNTYDVAGRLLTKNTPDHLTTTWEYTNGGRTVTVTHPGGRTETTEHFFDGRVKSVVGSAVIPQYFAYSVDQDGNQVTEVHFGTQASPRFVRTTTDPLGRTIRVVRPGPQGLETTTQTYDARGLLTATSRPGLANEVYVYDELGNRTREGLDADGDGQLDLSSERVSEQDTTFAQLSGALWLQTEHRAYASGSSPKTTGVDRSRLTGFAGGVMSESMSVDIDGNTTTSTTTLDRGTHTVRRTRHGPDSTLDSAETSTNGFVTATDSKTGLHVAVARDGLGRVTGVTDPRTGTTATAYDGAGRVESVTTPDSAQTRYGYDAVGRQNLVTNANGKTVRLEYNDKSQLIHRWGSATHPVAFGYDPYGAVETQTTYRDESDWSGGTFPTASGGDTTTWHHDEPTGLLTSKEDPSSRSTQYAYDPGGRIHTRTDARGTTTTYGYQPKTGDLLTVDYTGTTPDVTFTYDRMGRPLTVTDVTGLRTFEYDEALRVKSETVSGHVITPKYATSGVVGRTSGIQLDGGYDVNYGYDAYGRLETVGWTIGAQTDTARYGYRTDSNLLDHVSTTNGPSAQYGYEPKRDLRTKVENLLGAGTISKYEPSYDPLGRVKALVAQGSALEQTAGAHWIFAYDDRNELTGAQHYQGASPTDTAQPLAQDGSGFSYDASGNRLTESEAAVPFNYTPNPLDQYTSRTGGGSSETFVHDNDGNLTSVTKDGEQTQYTYDAENRLTQVQPQTPTNGDLRADFKYDYRGRRISKISYESQSGAWVQKETIQFLWDGWNLLAEIKTPSAGGATTCNYVWGLDVSQSVYGAGGIGGLVASVKSGSTRYYSYDANGNVGQVTEGGTVVAKYEYDPYGKITAKSGAAADDNPFRFSTKYFDAESRFYYYGYRYYSTELGRWTSRDPAADGTNLYGFVGNSPGNGVDALGLKIARYNSSGVQWDLEPREQAQLSLLGTFIQSIDAALEHTSCLSKGDQAKFENVKQRLIKRAQEIENWEPIDPHGGPLLRTPGEGTVSSDLDGIDPYALGAAAEQREQDRLAAYDKPLIRLAIQPGDLGAGLLVSGAKAVGSGIGRALTESAGARASVGADGTLIALSEIGRGVEQGGEAAKIIQEALRAASKECAAADTRPVVVGEDMAQRVIPYAETVGDSGAMTINEWLDGRVWTQELNDQFIASMKAEGREVIDIGPAFGRRALNRQDPAWGRPASDVYGTERKALLDYDKYTSVYERTGKYEGGVPGLDY